MDESNRRELTDGYVHIKEHFEALWKEREGRLNDRFAAQNEALNKSRQELERRLEALNELRSAVEKDRTQFVKSDVYDVKTAWYDDWCRAVDKKLSALDARYATWLIAIGIFFSSVQVALHLWGNK